MQVVAKKHHIDIKGQIPETVIKYIVKKYGKKDVTVIDDEAVDFREMEWFKKIEAERTPGGTLRAYRNRDRLSQGELAARLGIYKQNVSGMENGSRPISVEMAKKLAEFFNTSYKRFL